MKAKRWATSLLVLAMALGLACGHASASPHYVPPLAAQAKPVPDKYPETLKADHIEAERVRYSVLIGLRDFDALETEARGFEADYLAHRIDGDRFVELMRSMQPKKAGSQAIEDLKAWTQQKPKSYAAWFVLGRQYYDLAGQARGDKFANQTAPEEFAAAERLAKQAHDALTTSLGLFAKPTPSFAPLMGVQSLGGPYAFGGDDRGSDTCAKLQSFLPSLNLACRGDMHVVQLKILNAAIRVDPDALSAYKTYAHYTVPRWGGRIEDLIEAYQHAKADGRMSKAKLAELLAIVTEAQAAEAKDMDADMARARSLYVQAFDANPIAENLGRLYAAADAANRMEDSLGALHIYDRIIATRGSEYRALFSRGWIFNDKLHDTDRFFTDMISAALLGDMAAQNNIGYAYMTGMQGFPVNLQEAKRWLTLAANQGYQHARDKLPLVDAMIAKASAASRAK